MAVCPIDAIPMPKPAMPCSVKGVLKTRSRPMCVRVWIAVCHHGRGRQCQAYRILLQGPAEDIESWTVRESANHTMVQRNTPPNATSSPKTTAVSSFASAILPACQFYGRSNPPVVPQCISYGLVYVHLPCLATSYHRSHGARTVFVGPRQPWRTEGRLPSGAKELRGCYRGEMTACWWRLNDAG